MIELKTNNTSVTVFAPTGETLKSSYDKGYKVGYSAGNEIGKIDGYYEGYTIGYGEGLASVEYEKEQSYIEGWNDGNENGYSSGYDAGYEDGKTEGYNSAVKEGTITITGASRILSISGLPSIPKELHLLGLIATTPTDDNDYFVGSLSYFKDGFNYGTSTAKIQAAVWLRTTLNVSAMGGANGSIAESTADRRNVFTFENGTFTIDMSYHNHYTFGENYTYKWTAIF